MQIVDKELSEKMTDLYNLMVKKGVETAKVTFDTGVEFECKMCPSEYHMDISYIFYMLDLFYANKHMYNRLLEHGIYTKKI